MLHSRLNLFINATIALLSILVLFHVVSTFAGLLHRPLMSPAAAISFILVGIALWAARQAPVARIWHLVLVSCGISILCLALVSLVQAGASLPYFIDLDRVLYPSRFTAVQFLLCALAMLAAASPWQRKFHWMQGLALCIMILTLTILVTFFLRSQSVQQLSQQTGIAVVTNIGLLFVAAALFFRFPDVGICGYLLAQSTGAAAQRYLIPFAIIVPIAALTITHRPGGMGFMGQDGEDVLAIMLLIISFSLGTFYLRRLIDNSETQFQIMTNAAPVMIWMARPDGHTYYFNEQWLKFTGRSLADEVATEFSRCIHPDDLEHVNAAYKRSFRDQTPCTQEYRLLHHDGEYRWILEHAKPFWSIAGKFKGFIGSCTDITGQKQASEKMQLAAHVFENSDQGIVISNVDNRIIMTNPAFTELTGYSAEEVLHKDANYLSSQFYDTEFFHKIWAVLNKLGCWKGEVWNRRKDGGTFLEDLSLHVVRDIAGRPAYYIGIFTDITQRRLSEEHYRRQAHFDPLTNLPNRTLLADRIEQAVSRAQRYGHKMAVMFIDLDKFKMINDQLGHHIGDLLLKAVAERLKNSIRLEDTAARLGGDEFVVLLPTINDEKDAFLVGEKILQKLSQPYRIEEHCFDNHPSIGVALFPDHGQEMKTLLEKADKAMYASKQSLSGKHLVFYRPEK